MARMFAGLLWGAGIIYIATLLPLGYLNALYGWGKETNRTEVLIRCLLLIFPIIRSTALYMMIASLVRSAGKGIALGYAAYMLIFIITSVFQEVFETDITYPTSMTNAAYLLVPQNARNVVLNGKTVTIYDTAVTGDMVWKTIVVSLVFTAIYMTVAYINFKKTDRD